MRKRSLTTAQMAVLMAVLTMLSKSVGFLRELILANYYGAGMITDAYIMASQIPGALLASVMTAFGTAYMPLLSEKMEKEGQDSADVFTSRMVNFLFLINGTVIILGIIFAKPLVNIFARGFDEATSELTVVYLRIAFLLLIGNVLISIFIPYLQYRGKMLVTVLFDFTFSLSIIAFIIISVYAGHFWLIWGIVVGYAIRGIAMALNAKKVGFLYSLDFKFKGAVKEVFLLALPIFIGGSISQINTFIDRMLASTLPSGSVSALSYGNLISGFLISITVTVIVTIMYPKLNMAFATDNYERIGVLTESVVNLFAVFCIPFSLGAMAYANPVIQVIYERGAFANTATDITAKAFFFYSAGMMFCALNQLLTKVFFSMHDTKSSVQCSVIAVVTNIVLNLILIRIMGIGGLALATSIAQAVNAVALYYMFKHKYPQITLLREKKKIIQICVFSLIAVGISYIVYSYIGSIMWLPRMILLGIAILVACFIYLLLLYLAKFEEISILKDLVRR